MTQNNEPRHTQIRCGTILVNDIEKSVALYRDVLHQQVVESGRIDATTAESWGAPRLVDAKTYLLQPKSKASCYLRLVQSPDKVMPTPHATTHGWCAYEINVEDVFALAEQLEGTDFTVVGPPKRLDSFANVIPMQVVGPDQEVLFLNQVLASDEHSDLPMADCTVDRIFIAVLAASDRNASVLDYENQLACRNVGTFAIRYSLINRAFGLDFETKHELSLLQDQRTPLIEVDQYPAVAKPRPVTAGNLSHGNAMVSLFVNDLDELDLQNTITEQPIQSDSLLYGGRRSIVIRGLAGECTELIEGNR